MPSSRDLRLDFYRGLALFIIFVDHVDRHVNHNVFTRFTLGAWAWCDAAEIFVFVSGYLYGRIYARIITSQGFAACLEKSLRRCVQLYIANGIALLAVLLIVQLFAFDDYRLIQTLYLQPLVNQPVECLLYMPLLLYVPYLFDVLRLYMLFLILMPGFVWLTRRSKYLTLLVSLTLYAGTQYFSWLDMPVFFRDPSRFYFNPLAWQLLFVIGMVVGNRSPIREPTGTRHLLTVVAVCCIVVGTCVRLFPSFAAAIGEHTPTFTALLADMSWLWEKPTLGPVRILYFLSLAHIASALMPAASSIWTTHFARPFVLCGQHSLEVFCLSIVFTYCATILTIKFELSVLAYCIVMFAFLVLMVYFASKLRTNQNRHSATKGNLA